MSYFSQAIGLAVQNFLSAATGIAVLIAVIRGFSRRGVNAVGNFWVDMTRATLYVLIPFSLVIALLLVSQGVVQNVSAYVDVATLQHGQQTLPMGPAASQIAIKMLGTNGGVSSTPTPRIRSRIRRRSPTSSRCWRSFLFRRHFATPSAAWSAIAARAGRCSPPCCLFSCR